MRLSYPTNVIFPCSHSVRPTLLNVSGVVGHVQWDSEGGETSLRSYKWRGGIDRVIKSQCKSPPICWLLVIPSTTVQYKKAPSHAAICHTSCCLGMPHVHQRNPCTAQAGRVRTRGMPALHRASSCSWSPTHRHTGRPSCHWCAWHTS